MIKNFFKLTAIKVSLNIKACMTVRHFAALPFTVCLLPFTFPGRSSFAIIGVYDKEFFRVDSNKSFPQHKGLYDRTTLRSFAFYRLPSTFYLSRPFELCNHWSL